MDDMRNAYYPPRARWYSPLFHCWRGLRRRLYLDRIKLPSALNARLVIFSLLVPGFALRAYGRRIIARAVFFCYALSTAVFIIWLGHPASSLALGAMISLHVTSVLYLIGGRIRELDLGWRAVMSLGVLALVNLCIYHPLQRQVETRFAMPLRVGDNVVMVGTHQSAGAIRRGDWVAYRIESRTLDHFYMAAGLSLGRVAAVEGDRVTFTRQNFQVNGASFPRLPHMPVEGTLIVPEKH